MGSARSCIAASLTVCSVYVVYVHVYRSHKLLKTNVLNNYSLPSFAFLYMKYLLNALTRNTGCLYPAAPNQCEVAYTVINCRLDTQLFRRFCSAGGYGWDYPDSEYRDIPLCFPELLCGRLLLMVLSDVGFRLSPAGLVCVRQSLKSLQPVDELKKGPFTLQVKVLLYRPVDVGAEVDICLSATSRTGCPVWESVLTLLSHRKPHEASGDYPKNENQNEPVSQDVKQVELRVPRTPGLQSVWSFSDCSPCRLLSRPARLCGYRRQTASSLWMLSVCLAEIEKHKGVGVITAPVNITVHFEEPVLAPGTVTIGFWETKDGALDGSQSATQGLGFHMQKHGSNKSHVVGLISRSSQT